MNILSKGFISNLGIFYILSSTFLQIVKSILSSVNRIIIIEIIYLTRYPPLLLPMLVIKGFLYYNTWCIGSYVDGLFTV